MPRQKKSQENRLVAIVGMCGAGKSEVADQFVKAGYNYIRLGQITLDEVKRRGLKPIEKNEKSIREGFRKKYGMGAFAILNLPRIRKAIVRQPVIADGLYSWSEYKVFKKEFGEDFKTIAVIASPAMRHQRLVDRRKKYQADPKMKYRSFSFQEAESRDYSEIENSDKGGPIAMADYYLLNESTIDFLKKETKNVIKKISQLN